MTIIVHGRGGSRGELSEGVNVRSGYASGITVDA